MAVTASCTDASTGFPTEADFDILKMRLLLEGCTWRHPVISLIFSGGVYLHHPIYGGTYFTNWNNLRNHHDRNWEETFWPRLEYEVH